MTPSRRAAFVALSFALVLSACGEPERPPEPAPPSTDASPPPATPQPPPASPLLDPSLATEQAPADFKVRFETTKGDFVVAVTRDWAPQGADRHQGHSQRLRGRWRSPGSSGLGSGGGYVPPGVASSSGDRRAVRPQPP